ncbi:DUF2339 domain-containing protein [Altererythrobacter sp. MF3-039]|uniref:DUF2339 domain-containing protein n=1 Tax=Altererythrobacter sp. MF3-039 TaxID=3252901 RepID=UPI00390C69E9
MTWLMIFGLAGIVAYLWNRLDRAERRLEAIDDLQERTLIQLRDLLTSSPPAENETRQEAAPDEQEPQPTVPKIAAKREAPPAVLKVGRPGKGAPADVATEQKADPPQPARPRFELPKFAFDFEDIFGRKLPIWGGGVALAVAGVFLVRFAIEAGLLTPTVRVAMAFLFGILLLGGAELARQFNEKVPDERVAQALAGAGLATLYAGFYLAGTQYGLIGKVVAFLGLAGVTASAIGLSFRFGLPSAVLGLVGGFAAPALVGSDGGNIPLLALYLGLVTAGLTFTGDRQKRQWMSIAALVGGLGWGALLLLTGDFGTNEVFAVGLYLLVLGAVLPALASAGRFTRYLRLGAAALASMQLAVLVDAGGYSELAWGLYLLMAAALAYLGWRNDKVREASAFAAAIGVFLLMQWPDPSASFFALVAASLAVILAGAPLALAYLQRERLLDLAQIGAVPLALAMVAYSQFGSFDGNSVEGLLALATAVLASLPLVGAWLIADRVRPTSFAALCASGLAMVFTAMLMVTPPWSAPVAALPSLAAAAWLCHTRGANALVNVFWGGGAVAALALIATPDFFDEFERVVGMSGGSETVRALMRWLAVTASFAALAWLEQRIEFKRAAEALAAALFYGTLAQVLPADVLAGMAALLAIALVYVMPARIAAQSTLAAIAFLWALEPLGMWLGAGLSSLASDPVFVIDLPEPFEVLTRLLPAAFALALLRVPDSAGRHAQLALRAIAITLALAGLHTLFKQLFAIETLSAFVDYGMIERTIWQALILGAAWIAMKAPHKFETQRTLGAALAAAALVHFALYTGIIHNPLWDRQSVGPAPIANLALLAYAIAAAAALSLRAWLTARWHPLFDGLVVLLTSLGALTLLRQIFAGAIPVDAPLGPTEDLLRSVIGIALAIGFLILGAHRKERSWRVGSLVLMLIAVAKVFIFDAAGLEGLIRIASFMALGFSLIGIGWIYSRQLRLPDADPER